jgi:hypothetical protein
MMTAQEILQQYESGDETATGVMLKVLSQNDKTVVRETLTILPYEILKDIKRFIGHYNSQTRLFNGPRPNMGTVQFVKRWFRQKGDALLRRRNGPRREHCHLRTVPIGVNPDFRALESTATAVLQPMRYKLVQHQGSSSWTDPADDIVRFKLCNFEAWFFFGVREEWASVLGIPLSTVGPRSCSVNPSPVLFRGDSVTNSPEGQGRIEAIVELFPPARAGRVALNGQTLEEG